MAAAAAVPRPNRATVAKVAALALRIFEIMFFLLAVDMVAVPVATGGSVLDTIAAAIEATAPPPASSANDPSDPAARTRDARRP